MNYEKWVTLLYLDDKIEYNAQAYADDDWSSDWYYIVQLIPRLEMLGKNEPEIFEEFIQQTSTGEWLEQERRPIRCGDIICFGNQPWMLAQEDKVLQSLPAHKLQVWSDYRIVQLAQERAQKLLCET